MLLYVLYISTFELIDLREYFGHKNEIDHLNFAGVIDAGSSGTRLNIYGFNELKMIEVYYVDSIEPGMSALLKHEIKEQLDNLVTSATKNLKDFINDFKKIPIAYEATAGLRLIPDKESLMILKQVKKFFKDYNLKDNKIITGAKEGILGLRSLLLQKKMEHFIIKKFGCDALKHIVSENYCKEIYRHLSHNHSYGIIDMGGGSVEVAYLKKDSNELLSQSFLGFGVNESLREIKSHPSFLSCKMSDISSSTCKKVFESLFYKAPTINLTNELKDMNEIFLVSFIYDRLFYNNNFKKSIKELEGMFKEKCDSLEEDTCVEMYFLIILLKYFKFKEDTKFFMVSKIFGITVNWTIAKAYDLLFKNN